MIIGLTGRAGVGKDTVADMLVATYGFKKTAFAAPIKDMLAVAGFPEPARDMKEKQVEGFDFTWRKAAQTLGTEWGRSLDADLWLKIVMLKLADTKHNWVVSDVRFYNEAAAIRKVGHIMHIVGRSTTVSGEQANHVSESGVRRHEDDWVIDNSRSLACLAVTLENMVGDYFA